MAGSQDQDLRTVESAVFNSKIGEVVGSFGSADKNLVKLVIAAGYRWFDKDRGGNDTIKNLINKLSDYPVMQAKTISAIKTFAPLTIEEDPKTEGSYLVATTKKLSALSEDEKLAFTTAIDTFAALDLKRITDYGKKKGGGNGPKKLDLLSTNNKAVTTLTKLLEKAEKDGVSRAAALSQLAIWIDAEIAKATAPATPETPADNQQAA
ncbi:hypothetical protein ACLIX5_004463 [Salmonella enterica subsp. enterica serovar Bredeney]